LDSCRRCLDHEKVRGKMRGNHFPLSLRYPNWTLFLVLTLGIFVKGTKKPEFSPENSGAVEC